MKSVLRYTTASMLCVTALGGAAATAQAADSWAPAATMPAPFGSLAGLNDGRVLATGAGNDTDPTSPAAVFNPATNSWSPAGTISRDDGPMTTLSDGTVLIAGGSLYTDDTTSSAEIYDPATNSWTGTAPMSTAREGHTATLLANGKVLVAGGADNASTFLASAELFDPVTGSWAPTGSMSTARVVSTATLLTDGRVLVVGGRTSGGDTASAEIYDPTTGAWSPAGSMSTPRQGFTSTLLPSGKVLVAGGASSGDLLSAEVYDPATNSWSRVADMREQVSYGAATLLGNGKVLVAGGGSGANAFSSAELYDPATDTWSQASAMSTPREYLTGVLLANGKFLVVGGANSSGQLASAEIYTPALQVNVSNKLDPQSDGGRFDLQVNGSTVRGAAADGEGGTGTVDAGGDVTVGEVGSGTTRLADYDSRIDCGSAGAGNGSGLVLHVVARNVSCTIANKRKPVVAPLPRSYGGLILHSQTVKLSRRGTIRLKLTCPASAAGYCAGLNTLRTLRKVRVATAASRKPRARLLAVGSRRFSLKPARTASITIKLSKRARRMVSRKHSLRLKELVSSHDASQVAKKQSARVTVK
jgi:N-acetylneuraminic acid mutarotase